MENFENRAAPEGSFSNLVCRARGSSRLRFRWSKDGRVFNTSLTTRNVWHMRLAERDEHSHMAILNINDITIYDKGQSVVACPFSTLSTSPFTTKVRINVATCPSSTLTTSPFTTKVRA